MNGVLITRIQEEDGSEVGGWETVGGICRLTDVIDRIQNNYSKVIRTITMFNQ